MAKGKKAAGGNPAGRTVADLTADEVKKLGSDLVRWQGNVYGVVKSRFGIDTADDTIFERLKLEGDAFRCDLCDGWKLMSEFDGDPKRKSSDICTDCAGGGHDNDEEAK